MERNGPAYAESCSHQAARTRDFGGSRQYRRQLVVVRCQRARDRSAFLRLYRRGTEVIGNFCSLATGNRRPWSAPRASVDEPSPTEVVESRSVRTVVEWA